ncbi:hypothetical protein HMPREF9123_1995 [Neisseria bacilliformis ATCC BAA-1200]|uniref:Uncharacterized protein n=1 Tax=Neisseria bacilliformis ATCC BAA-1200 TaxID=888742 RepID=F2BE39_9NEIS|nr:hypothetical protein HMPREF9123_1995 [Neisseria bacilliformis ATCC BAA-1200]
MFVEKPPWRLIWRKIPMLPVFCAGCEFEFETACVAQVGH